MTLPLLAQQAAAPKPFWEGDVTTAAGLWIAVGLTLAIYTFLYRDNPVFKLAEHVYVGVTNGYLLWQAWFTCVKPELAEPLGRLFRHAVRPAAALEKGDSWWLLVPAALSLFMLLRFHPKTAWLSRWSFAFIVGAGAGTLIPLTIKGQIFAQMGKMLESPIVREQGRFSLTGTLNAVLLLAGVLSVLTYFIFSFEHKGPVRRTARLGVVFLMIAFGAHFGYTVMGRESLLIERAQFLMDSAAAAAPAGSDAPAPHRATLWMLLAVVAAMVAIEVLSRRGKQAEGEGGDVESRG